MSSAGQGPPADSVHAVLDEVFADAKYDWESEPSPFQFLWDLFRKLLFWFDTLESQHPVTYWTLMAVLAVILITILTHFGYLLARALKYRGPDRERAAARPAVRRDAAWYLAEARRLATEGRRAESLGYRFRALVLELERHHALAFHPSKTPAEYLRDDRLEGASRTSFAALVRELYRHLFGGEPVSDEDLEAFDRRADEVIRINAAH